MSTTDTNNTLFKVAADLINKTSQHIFLTGKAGTGKTTFLHYIKKHTTKQCAVVAPTGVAAINAGGVTMHSFFQLPFTPFVPVSTGFGEYAPGQVTDKTSLFRNIRFANDKRKIFEKLELLIIDEVSMVRADMLDAVDTILRSFRNKNTVPFGGVQLLYIGDMFQLPPVVKDYEWNVLRQYYRSSFFFDAQVICEKQPLHIELTKIYRQRDNAFIDILNNVRNNTCTADDLAALNGLYKNSKDDKRAIVLTTHNHIADAINERELNKLTGQTYNFRGVVEGDFNDKILPIDLNIRLRVGAKVMFIRNDVNKKYYNGKIATVSALDTDEVTVIFDDENEAYTLQKEEWKNIRYTLNDQNELEEEELGSFTQFPLRLAWAVTIHKSQGLTFENVIIDAGQSFAAGQVYVALSRCTKMEGIVLRSIITAQSIRTDERILAFSKDVQTLEQLNNVLQFEKEAFLSEKLKSFFYFDALQKDLRKYADLVAEKQLPNYDEVRKMATAMIVASNGIVDIANKFQPRLDQLLQKVQTDKPLLYEKVQSGIDYFTKEIIDKILGPLQLHLTTLAGASKVKQYVAATRKIERSIWETLVHLNNAYYDNDFFSKNQTDIQKYNPSNIVLKKKDKPQKGETYVITYQLYVQGKTAAEIAAERGLAETTIEGHLAMQVRSGKIPVTALVPEHILPIIINAIQEDGSRSTNSIKALLPSEITHGQVRAVLNHLDWLVEREN
jgi:hypothetical protein